MEKRSSALARLPSTALGVFPALFALAALLTGVLARREFWIELAFGMAALAAFLLLRKTFPAMETWPFWCAPTAAVCLTVLARVAFAGVSDLIPDYDFARYFATATAMAAGQPIPDAAYQALFPHLLGYPAVLSLLLRATGPSLNAAQGLNIVLDALSCLMIFNLVRRRAGTGGATCAAALFALNPAGIMHVPLPCSEPLFVALMLACLTLFAWAADGQNDRTDIKLARWAGLGALTALTNAVRPLGLILLVAAVLWLLIFQSGRFFRRLAPLAALLAAYVLLGLPISAVESAALGHPSAQGAPGWNLYVGMNAGTAGAWSAEDYAQLSDMLDRDMPARDIQAAFWRRGVTRLGENLRGGELPLLLARKFSALWGRDSAMVYWMGALQRRPPAAGDGSLDLLRQAPVLTLLSNAYWWALLLLFAAAAPATLRALSRDSLFLLCVTALIGFALLFLVLEANGRYHYPADALLAIAAGLRLGAAPKNPHISTGRRLCYIQR